MELGATLCLPRRPRCLLCPLRPGCRAAAGGQPELYPEPRRRRAGETLRLVVAVVAREGRVLLYRRPPSSGLLAGTWELPWLEVAEGAAPGTPPAPGAALPTAHRSEPSPTAGAGAALAAKYGGQWQLGPKVGWVRHSITYRDLRVAVHLADWRGGRGDEVREGTGPEAGRLAPCRDRHDPGVEHGWFDAAARAALPMSSLVGKVLKAADGRGAEPPADRRPAAARSAGAGPGSEAVGVAAPRPAGR
jgi:hypothetical protein